MDPAVEFICVQGGEGGSSGDAPGSGDDLRAGRELGEQQRRGTDARGYSQYGIDWAIIDGTVRAPYPPPPPFLPLPPLPSHRICDIVHDSVIERYDGERVEALDLRAAREGRLQGVSAQPRNVDAGLAPAGGGSQAMHALMPVLHLQEGTLRNGVRAHYHHCLEKRNTCSSSTNPSNGNPLAAQVA